VIDPFRAALVKYVVRAAGNPQQLAGDARAMVQRIDRTASVMSLQTMDQVVENNLMQERRIAQIARAAKVDPIISLRAK
jgi:hypothetical protein